MTLNGVMAIILPYFAEFGNFRDQLRKSGWAINRFSPEKCHKSTPTKHGRAVLFAVAELLVTHRIFAMLIYFRSLTVTSKLTHKLNTLKWISLKSS